MLDEHRNTGVPVPLTFVVVVANGGRSLSRECVEQITNERPQLLFEPTAETTWTNARRSVLVRAWEAPEPAFGLDTQWSDSEGFTAFSGHLWSQRERWAPGTWPKNLASRCRVTSPPAMIEELAGIFALVHLDQDGHGWVGTDALSLNMLYEGTGDDFVAYSPRAAAAAWAVTPPGRVPPRDPIGCAWLAYSSYFIGDRTGFAGVRVVPIGQYVEVSPDHGARRRVWSAQPWSDVAEASSDQAIDAVVDAVRTDVAQRLGVIAELPAAELRTGLTGGKDSRLLLAVALEQGIADAFDFRSQGRQSLPDVVIGRQLAERFSLRHEWGLFPPPPSPLSYSQRLCRIVRDGSGMSNIWYEVRREPNDARLEVSGLGGEVMRTNSPNTANLKSHAELERRYRNGFRFGGLGLVQQDVQAELERSALASMFDDATGRMDAVDLVDSWYIRNRIRRWGGAAQEIGPPRVLPLYSLSTARAAFAIGPTLRRSEFLHQRVIAASCPELLDWEFAETGWPAAEVTSAVARRHPFRKARRGRAESAPTTAGPPTPRPSAERVLQGNTANQQHQDRTLALKKQLFEEMLVGDPTNPVFDVIDRERTRDAIERIEQLGIRDRMELWGAATAAIWLGHHEDA